ncbi:MAG: hypothetical protein ACP5PB_10820 [Acidimicrobiales bacterium]
MEHTHGLVTKYELDTRMRRIGRLVHHGADYNDTTAPSPSALSLLRSHKALPEGLSLNIAPAIRSADADGRIKLSRGGLLSDLLGWRPGCLSVLCDGPWLVLTQTDELVGVARRRHSQHATFTRDAKGVERVGLAPAHLARIGSLPGREILLIPAPATLTLVLANPLVALAAPPATVSRAFEPETAPSNVENTTHLVNHR